MEVMNFGWVLKNELAGAQGPSSIEDLSYLHQQGVRAVIRMEERTIAADTGTMVDLIDMFEPVQDFTPPELEQIQRMIEFIDQQIEDNHPVAVSCYAGIGRISIPRPPQRNRARPGARVSCRGHSVGRHRVHDGDNRNIPFKIIIIMTRFMKFCNGCAPLGNFVYREIKYFREF